MFNVGVRAMDKKLHNNQYWINYDWIKTHPVYGKLPKEKRQLLASHWVKRNEYYRSLENKRINGGIT